MRPRALLVWAMLAGLAPIAVGLGVGGSEVVRPYADLAGRDLSGRDLTGADLRGADLARARD